MDSILLDQIAEDTFDGENTFSKEEVREATEGNLIKRGRWEGQLQPDSVVYTVQTEDGNHPLEGEKVVRCHVIVNTDEGDRHLFFYAVPKLIKLTSQRGGTYIHEASKNGGFLYAATKLYGRPFSEVLRYAMEHRLVYDIGVKKATDQYPAQNVLRGVYSVAA